MGARASTFGLEFSGKVELVESEDSPWVVSLVPVVGVQRQGTRFDERGSAGDQRSAALPVVVGLKTGEGSQVVPRPCWPSEHAFTLGGSWGTLRATPRLRLMPEVAVMMPLEPLPTAGALREASTRPHVQFALAVMLDSAGDE